MNELPQRYNRIIRACLDEYGGQIDHCYVNDQDLIEFIHYMMQEIRQNQKF